MPKIGIRPLTIFLVIGFSTILSRGRRMLELMYLPKWMVVSINLVRIVTEAAGTKMKIVANWKINMCLYVNNL